MKMSRTTLIYVLPLVFLVAFRIVTMSLPSDFVSLPDGINCFDDLSNPDLLNQPRLVYRGASVGVIYAIIIRINNKLYIGSTSDPFDRFYRHLVTGRRSNRHLQRAIAKYGLQ
jgi:hypothetical protein